MSLYSNDHLRTSKSTSGLRYARVRGASTMNKKAVTNSGPSSGGPSEMAWMSTLMPPVRYISSVSSSTNSTKIFSVLYVATS